VGDGVTVGGNPAGAAILADLADVEIGVYGNVGQHGEALENNDVLQYNDATNQWENRTNMTLNGDIAVNGGDVTTTAAIGNLFNTTTPVVNIGNGATTEVNLGATGVGRVQIKSAILDVNGTLTVPSITTDSGESLTIIPATGQGLTIGTTLAPDPVIIKRDTSQTNISTRTLVTRVDSTGTPAIGLGNVITLETETTPGTFGVGGYLETLSTAATGGVLDTFKMNFGLMNTVGGVTTVSSRMTLEGNGDLQIDGDLEVTGGDIDRSTSGQANIFNFNTNDINLGNSAGTTRIGAGGVTNTVLIKPGILVGEGTTQNVFNTVAETVNAFGFANTINMGATGSLTTLGGDLAVNGGDITTTSTTGNLFNNDGVPVVNIGNGATTEVNLGNGSLGRVQIKSPQLDVNGNATITGNLTVNGTTTSIDTVNLVVEDNIITINKNQTGTPPTSLRSGIEVERGDSVNVQWQWNELNKWWEAEGGADATERNIWAAGNIVAGSVLATNGNDIFFNNADAGSGATSSIIVKRGSILADVAFRWNQTALRWESTTNGSSYIALPNQALDTGSNPTFAGIRAGNIFVGDTTDNEIDTITGNLTIDSAGGTVTVDDILVVNDNLTVFGSTTLGNASDDVVSINSGTVNIGTTSINAAVTVGDAATDSLTVNATTTFNNNVTIGSSAADTLTVTSEVAGNIFFTDNATTTPRGVTGTVGGNDQWFVGGAATASDAGFMVIATGDGGNEPIFVRQYTGAPTVPGSTITREIALMNVTGDSVFNNITVGSNGFIYSSSGLALTVTGNDVAVSGNLQVTGNNIKSSSTNSAITLNDVNVKVNGELTVTGNKIRSSGGTAFPLGDIAVQLSGSNVEVVGNLTVTGNTINSSTAPAITLSGANVTIAGDLTVNGTTTTINSTTLDVDDKNITIAKGAANAAAADGGGLTLEGPTTPATLLYEADDDSWNLNKPTNVAGAFTADSASTNVYFYEDNAGDQIAATIARTVITTSTATTTITTTTRKTMKVMVTVDDGTDTQCIEALVMRDAGEASGAQITLYGELNTGTGLAVFTADYDGGAGVIRLRATSASATSTTFKVVRTALF
jgi:hypothetical protein